MQTPDLKRRVRSLSPQKSSLNVCRKCGTMTHGSAHACDVGLSSSRRSSRKTTATVVSAILIVGLLAAVFVYHNIKTTPAKPLAPMVSGQWRIEIGKQSPPGIMQLQQEGTSVWGQGRDAAGTFSIQGQMAPADKLTFLMRYSEESRRRGAHSQDILCSGKVLRGPNETLSCSGELETQIKTGSALSILHKPRWMKVRNTWSAQRTSTVTPTLSHPVENRWSVWNPLKMLVRTH